MLDIRGVRGVREGRSLKSGRDLTASICPYVIIRSSHPIMPYCHTVAFWNSPNCNIRGLWCFRKDNKRTESWLNRYLCYSTSVLSEPGIRVAFYGLFWAEDIAEELKWTVWEVPDSGEIFYSQRGACSWKRVKCSLTWWMVIGKSSPDRAMVRPFNRSIQKLSTLSSMT